MKLVNTPIIRRATHDFGLTASCYPATYGVGSASTNRDPMLGYSFWRIAIECARAGLIWDGRFLQFVPVDLLCDALLSNASRIDPIGELVPTLPVLDTRTIAPPLKCKVIPPADFFDWAYRQHPVILRRFSQNTSYRDIEISIGESNLSELISLDRIPDPYASFAADWQRKPIQRAVGW